MGHLCFLFLVCSVLFFSIKKIWNTYRFTKSCKIVQRVSYTHCAVPCNSYILYNYGTILKPENRHWCMCIYNSMPFITYMDSCNNHSNQDIELFYQHKDLPHAFIFPHFCTTFFNHWRLPLYSHLHNFVFWEFYVNEIRVCYLLKLAFFIQHNALEIHSIHCMYQYFIPFLLLSSIPRYGYTHSLFNYSNTEGCFCCFPLWAIEVKLLWIFMDMFLCESKFSFFWEWMPRSVLWVVW